MVKEGIKKCSTCGLNGHNARSCGGKKDKEICIKLFGFKIHVSDKHESATSSSMMIRKCKSTPNLIRDHTTPDVGYLSDGPRHETKNRGIPWTKKEHLSFLNGLENLGKGKWKEISTVYVHSKTATQVASHAQKYFNRLSLPEKRNRRSSLFDMSLNKPEIAKISPLEPTDISNAEITDQANDLSALSVNKKCDHERQANDFDKAPATSLTASPVLSYTPYYGAPNFSQMPYIPMMGTTGNGQISLGLKSYPPMPYIPMMCMPNPAYFYTSKGYEFQALNTPLFSNGSSLPMTRS